VLIPRLLGSSACKRDNAKIHRKRRGRYFMCLSLVYEAKVSEKYLKINQNE
jgi:hypothetical protein